MHLNQLSGLVAWDSYFKGRFNHKLRSATQSHNEPKKQEISICSLTEKTSFSEASQLDKLSATFVYKCKYKLSTVCLYDLYCKFLMIH